MLLNIENLSIESDGKIILENLNFKVGKGEIFAILGHNGSGKTTAAKAIIGLYDIALGGVIFDGKKINELETFERSKLGLAYIMQEIPEYTGITVGNYSKNILKDKFDENMITELFDVFGLDWEVYKKRNFDQHLSGGEKKKIEIIVNFMMDKKLYILDEVETSLDATSRSILKDLILQKSKEGTSFLVISHNSDLNEICQNGVLICNQKLQETGKIEDLLEKYTKKCKSCKHLDNCEYLKNK